MRKHLQNDSNVYYESDKPSFGRATWRLAAQAEIIGIIQLTMRQLVGILLLIVPPPGTAGTGHVGPESYI